MSDYKDFDATLEDAGSNTTVAFNSTKSSGDNREATTLRILAVCFSVLFLAGILCNCVVLGYILSKRLYRNYVSSHFIGHLCFTNLIGALMLVTIFLYNLWTDDNVVSGRFLCQLQAFLTCAVWTVTHYMVVCIAGVHLLTFARIHYDQLFGLSPTLLCGLAWIIGSGLGLPCITNSGIVQYDKGFHQCIWGVTANGYKFQTYMVILAIIIPTLLTWYAYCKVLGILYHSPIVFEALGLYKSRYLVYAFLWSPFYYVPVLVTRVIPEGWSPVGDSVCMFFGYFQVIVSPLLYGASMFLIKEEDMALTNRAASKALYTHPGVLPHQL